MCERRDFSRRLGSRTAKGDGFTEGHVERRRRVSSSVPTAQELLRGPRAGLVPCSRSFLVSALRRQRRQWPFCSTGTWNRATMAVSAWGSSTRRARRCSASTRRSFFTRTTSGSLATGASQGNNRRDGGDIMPQERRWVNDTHSSAVVLSRDQSSLDDHRLVPKLM